MQVRRAAFVSLAIVLVLLFLVPAVIADGGGASAAQQSNASPGSTPAGTATDALPAAGPAPVGERSLAATTVPRAHPTTATPSVSASIPVPAPADDRQQTGGDTGSGDNVVRAEGTVPGPMATHSVTPASAGSAGAGDESNGSEKVHDDSAPSPGGAPVTTVATTRPARAGASGGDTMRGGPAGGIATAAITTHTVQAPAAGVEAGQGEPAGGTMTAAHARTGETSEGDGPGAPRAATTTPAATSQTGSAGTGAPSTGGAGAGPGFTGSGTVPPAGTGATVVADSTGSGPGAGARADPTLAGGTGHGGVGTGHDSENGAAGPAPRAGPTAARSDDTPSGGERATVTTGPPPAGQLAFGAFAVAGAARGTGTGGAGQDSARGGPHSQNRERERRFPDPPAAAPVRTGLEPVESARDEGGRGRRGLPTDPLSMETAADTPDPLLFLRFLLFLGYRRLRPGTLLDNPLRQSLAAAIVADPGLDLAGCVAVTGANRETLRYHLALLVCGGRIVEETRNGSVRFFPRDRALSPVRRAVIHLERNQSLAPALHHIRDRPGIPRRELARLLDVAGPTVTRQVQRLVDEGLVENRGCGSEQGYWLTPECAGAFASIAGAERNRVMQEQPPDVVTV